MRRSDPPRTENEGAARPTWRRLLGKELTWDTFRQRALALEGIRAFFRARGFLEVDTPAAQPYPNLDPNVFPVRIADAGGRAGRFFLHTSPELAMKKLLSAGSGNIFFLGKVFRDREGSPLHHPEFTMLEWYRTGEPAESVMRDVEELVGAVASAVVGRAEIDRGGRRIPLSGPWERWELGAAFRALLGTSPDDEDALRAALEARGLSPGRAETREDLFFRACLDVIEPAVAGKGACFLTGFPASQAGLARRRPGDGTVAERFEGYLAGIELVNGYEELTDPEETEERLLRTASRLEAGAGGTLPVDPDFIEALRCGLPPASGAALGVDRLLMILLGKDTLADVTYR